MLVLSRKQGEEIWIGQAGQVLTGPIVVTAVDIRGDKVRIGVEAPKSISIHRSEVYQAIAREQQAEEYRAAAAAG